jgi:alpha-L-fucosidase
MDLTVFIHFGMNTFTGRSTGSGKEDPDTFNPTELDCEQWVIEAKQAGFHGIILTTKHHEGFCLWPTKTTDFSVASSAWRDGKGDVVREAADACKKHGLKFGVYCSPWDRHQEALMDSKAYSRLYKQQLTELLTNYGPIYEMWFDGNNANVPNWEEIITLVRTLQPDAIIKEGPRVKPISSDVRWVGTERASAPLRNWYVCKNGGPKGNSELIWFPMECDTPMIGDWFWADTLPLDMPTLMNFYYTSVGRGSIFLMNIAPNREGRFGKRTVERLHEYADGIRQIYEPDYSRMAGVKADASEVRGDDPTYGAKQVIDGDPETYWAANDSAHDTEESDKEWWITINFDTPRAFNVIRLEEPIHLGQRIGKYRLDAWNDEAQHWESVNDRGGTIGHRKLDRIIPQVSSGIRLTIQESRDTPLISSIGVHLDEVSPREHFEPEFANSIIGRKIRRMPKQKPIPPEER